MLPAEASLVHQPLNRLSNALLLCRSPLAQCLLVRFVAQVISESGTGLAGEQRPFFDFLESCLRHKHEMVIFEAARAICNMPNVTSRELTPAVTVLQLFLSSNKPVVRCVRPQCTGSRLRACLAHPG